MLNINIENKIRNSYQRYRSNEVQDSPLDGGLPAYCDLFPPRHTLHSEVGGNHNCFHRLYTMPHTPRHPNPVQQNVPFKVLLISLASREESVRMIYCASDACKSRPFGVNESRMNRVRKSNLCSGLEKVSEVLKTC